MNRKWKISEHLEICVGRPKIEHLGGVVLRASHRWHMRQRSYKYGESIELHEMPVRDVYIR